MGGNYHEFLNYFIMLYGLPAVVVYLSLRWNYKVYEPEKEPNEEDVRIIFIPVFNLIGSIYCLLFMVGYYLGIIPKKNKKGKKFNYNKFFKL